jgi:hypothetical protein
VAKLVCEKRRVLDIQASLEKWEGDAFRLGYIYEYVGNKEVERRSHPE